MPPSATTAGTVSDVYRPAALRLRGPALFEPVEDPLDATHGTAIVLGEAGINPRLVNKVHEGRPHIQDRIKNGEYTYIINTTSGRRAIEDSRVIRRSALQYKVHYDTTLNGGFATAMALNADATEKVISVQEMHAQIK